MSSWGLIEGYKMESSDFQSLLSGITDNIPVRIETVKLDTSSKNYIKDTITRNATLADNNGAIVSEIKEVSEKLIIMMASELTKKTDKNTIDMNVKTLYDNYFTEQLKSIKSQLNQHQGIKNTFCASTAPVVCKETIDTLASVRSQLKKKNAEITACPTPICPSPTPSYTLHDFMEKETHDPVYIIITILILLAIFGGGYWWFFLRDN